MAAIKGPRIIGSGKNYKHKDIDMDTSFVRESSGADDHDCRVTNRWFYFVKLHEFRKPDLVQAEELLNLRFAVSQTREEKVMQKNHLQSTLQNPGYYHVENWNRMRDGLRLLRGCIDDRIRLDVANGDITSKELKWSALRMLHGRSCSLAKERKALKWMNEAQSSAMKSWPNTKPCWADYHQIMERLEHSLVQTLHDPCKRKEEILNEIQQLRLAEEKAMENAGCRGDHPESSDCREDLEKKIKDVIKLLEGSRERLEEFTASAKELQKVVEDLACLDKRLLEIDKAMHGYYSLMPQWRKQHQEENSHYDENVSLLFRARKLADKKEGAALRGLSEGQVEEFLGRWNEDAEFRCEYQQRARTSLNSRGLGADGRTRNHDEEPIALDGPRIKLPNRIRKALIRKRPTMPT